MKLLVKVIISIAIFIFNINAYSQKARQTLVGVVLDSVNRNPISYATISAGRDYTFTNVDGEFIFKLNSDFDSVNISHIGYKQLKIAVNNVISQTNLTFELAPQALELNEIVIKSEKIKQKAKDIVERAIGKIEDNLLYDFGADALYRQIHYFNNVPKKKKEYVRLLEAGIRLNYSPQRVNTEILEIRRSDDLRFDRSSRAKSAEKRIETEKAGNNVSNFLKLDYQRNREEDVTQLNFNKEILGLGNLNSGFVKRHKFKIDTVVKSNKDWVYIIKILPTKKSIDLLRGLKRFMLLPVGKLYIRGSDYAIIQMEYSYIVNPKKAKPNFSYGLTQLAIGGNILFSDKLIFQSIDDKVSLSYLVRDIYDVQAAGGSNIAFVPNIGSKASGNREENGFFRVRKELIINNIYKDSKDSFFSHYTKKYDNLVPLTYSYNETFWQNFNFIKQTAEEKKLTRHLETYRPLVEQFNDGSKPY